MLELRPSTESAWGCWSNIKIRFRLENISMEKPNVFCAKLE